MELFDKKTSFIETFLLIAIPLLYKKIKSDAHLGLKLKKLLFKESKKIILIYNTKLKNMTLI